ncbi:hypothetical protein BC936DRAFT_150035 [Jimgerdemannia flammicorona]|uniref:SMP-LTD domain-containing protein n=1 Tax=Jimgerdemannia flammicorona TaxID=994334 RepID=A0A433CZM0_9FUNG|nr:hypothetical protein BC936DRAFT_150035 [Jimgerdemannia flammicorona]
MASFSALLIVYLLGGLTFVPLLLLLALVVLYFVYNVPVDRPSKTSLPIPKPADPPTPNTLDDTDGGNKYYKVGWVRVTREYRPGGLDTSNIGGMVMQGIQSYMQGKNAPQRRPKDSYFAVLKYNTLFLYDSEKQLDCRGVITMTLHSVSIYPPGLEEHELYSRPNSVRLAKKESLLLDDASTLVDPARSQSDHFLFCDRNSEKEDWYFALLRASRLESQSPGQPHNLGVADLTHFDQQAMNQLIQMVHSDESQFHTQWLNALIGRVFFAIYRTDRIREFLFNKVVKKTKKIKRPGFLGEILVRSVDIGQSIPYVTSPKLLGLTPAGELTGEANFQYSGGFRLEIETEATWQYSTRLKPIKVHLVLAVMLKRIKGKVFLRIKGPPSNRIWIGFYEPPQMEWSIEPVVSDKHVKFAMITNAIEARIREMINENMVLPNMDDFPFFPTEGTGGIFGETVPIVDEPVKVPQGEVSEGTAQEVEEDKEKDKEKDAGDSIEEENGSVNGNGNANGNKDKDKVRDQQMNGTTVHDPTPSPSDKDTFALPPTAIDPPTRTSSTRSLVTPKPTPPKLPPRRDRSVLSSPDGFVLPADADPVPSTTALEILTSHPDASIPQYDNSDTASILSVTSSASSASGRGRWLRRRPNNSSPTSDPDVLTAQNTIANANTKRSTIIGMAGNLLARGKEFKNTATERAATHRLSLSGSDHSGDEGQLAQSTGSAHSLVGQTATLAAATTATTAAAAAAAVVSAAKPLLSQRKGGFFGRRNTASSVQPDLAQQQAQQQQRADEGQRADEEQHPPPVVRASLSSPVSSSSSSSSSIVGSVASLVASGTRGSIAKVGPMDHEQVEKARGRRVEERSEGEAQALMESGEAVDERDESTETVVDAAQLVMDDITIPSSSIPSFTGQQDTITDPDISFATPPSSSSPVLDLLDADEVLPPPPPKPRRLRPKSSASTSVTAVNVMLAAAEEVKPEVGGFEVETVVIDEEGSGDAESREREEVMVGKSEVACVDGEDRDVMGESVVVLLETEADAIVAEASEAMANKAIELDADVSLISKPETIPEPEQTDPLSAMLSATTPKLPPRNSRHHIGEARGLLVELLEEQERARNKSNVVGVGVSAHAAAAAVGGEA